MVEFLNYEQTFHYVFDLRGMKHVHSDLFGHEESFAKSLGDLYIYELTTTDEKPYNSAFSLPPGPRSSLNFSAWFSGSGGSNVVTNLGKYIGDCNTG